MTGLLCDGQAKSREVPPIASSRRTNVARRIKSVGVGGSERQGVKVSAWRPMSERGLWPLVPTG